MNLQDIFKQSKSVKVEEENGEKSTIVITRKSRFIRKDATNMIDKCQKAKISPENIRLKINAPLCSKAKKLLEEEGFQICAI